MSGTWHGGRLVPQEPFNTPVGPDTMIGAHISDIGGRLGQRRGIRRVEGIADTAQTVGVGRVLGFEVGEGGSQRQPGRPASCASNGC